MRPKVEFFVRYGFYNEFLNCILNNGISLFGISQTDFGFTAKCYAADYRYIARQSAKFQCRTGIKRKIGIYFSFVKILKRKGIIAGAVCFAFLSFWFRSFIWKIEIKTDDLLLKNRIVSIMMENNVYAGAGFSKDRLYYTQQDIHKKCSEIAYVTLNFYQGVLECNVYPATERIDYSVEEDENDIVCMLGGVITDIKVYSGFPLVQAGQSVSSGDILVTTEETDKYNNISHSDTLAFIEGICRKEYSVYIPFEKNTKIYTGEHKTEYIMYTPFGVFESEKCDLASWQDYSQQTVVTYGSLSGFYLPYTIRKTTYYNKEDATISKDLLAVYPQLRTSVEHLILRDEKLKKEISRTYDYIVSENGVRIVCTVGGRYNMV